MPARVRKSSTKNEIFFANKKPHLAAGRFAFDYSRGLVRVVVNRLKRHGELDRDFLAGDAVLEEQAERFPLNLSRATVAATRGDAGEGVERIADVGGNVRLSLSDGSGEREDECGEVIHGFCFFD